MKDTSVTTTPEAVEAAKKFADVCQGKPSSNKVLEAYHDIRSHKLEEETEHFAALRILAARVLELEREMDGSASDTPRTDSEWNTYEPQCADASKLAELMYQWACEMERESERRRKDILRWVHRCEAMQRKMPNDQQQPQPEQAKEALE